MTQITLEQLYEDFALLDDWEERYRYVIELGRQLPPLPDALHVEATKVSGCASQVWIYAQTQKTDKGDVLVFSGDSDALIVKGLVAIAFIIFSGHSAAYILAQDAAQIFQKLGLAEHLTPQRANGLASMVARIRHEALAVQAA